MRKRDIQSFSLKLSDMKEYEVIRQARAQALRAQAEGNIATEETPAGDAEALKVPLVKFGAKSKQEIRERLGFPES